MAIILNIETSTKVCSAALHEDGKLIDVLHSYDGNSHSETLLPFINQLLRNNKISKSDLNAIGVSRGPGSYTGLRIGVSSAKGLAYALGIPLLSVDSLSVLAAKTISKVEGVETSALFCPMIDARRMEVYQCFFDHSGSPISEIKAAIVHENSFQNYLKESVVYFSGDGAKKCVEVLNHPNVRFVEKMYLSAEYMGKKTFEKFSNQKFEDVAYFEPFYLKEFVTNKPRKNLLS